MSERYGGKGRQQVKGEFLAVYSKRDQQVVFFGYDAFTHPRLAAELQVGTGISRVVDRTLRDMGVSDADEYRPGALGGTMRCGAVEREGARLPVCAWADAFVVATLYEREGKITPDQLAPVTQALRTAAEK